MQNTQLLVALLVGAVLSFALMHSFEQAAHTGVLINDVARLNPTYVRAIVQYDQITGLQQALADARAQNLKVSIAGRRHSMGGHTYYPGAVVLDMTAFDDVLAIDDNRRIVTVQSGATWDKVIAAINEHNLSIPVLQAYNGFTVGGSASVNVHESDPQYGSMIETVDSFRLLLADGSIVNVSRTENSELFGLVIGGYGLFGIILDVDIKLVENKLYQKNEFLVDYTQYRDTYFNKLLTNPEIENVFARLSVVRDQTFLRDVIVTTYAVTNLTDTSYFTLQPVETSKIKKFGFGLSRSYDWGKRLRWYMQKKWSDSYEPPIITRNNLDNKDVHFLDYNSPRDTDILQEYFVPVENLEEFIETLRTTVETNDINLLSATIRYVPQNTESVLSYSPQDMFGVVLYFNVPLDEEGQQDVTRWSRDLVAAALSLDGTYYLPYQNYATNEQIRKAYPRLDEFFAKKRQYDPQELFVNTFYKTYNNDINK